MENQIENNDVFATFVLTTLTELERRIRALEKRVTDRSVIDTMTNSPEMQASIRHESSRYMQHRLARVAASGTSYLSEGYNAQALRELERFFAREAERIDLPLESDDKEGT